VFRTDWPPEDEGTAFLGNFRWHSPVRKKRIKYVRVGTAATLET